MSKIKTRIAPSPTGFLHIGTARTALFNFLFVRQNNGEFILRIEDTDRERSKPEFEKDIADGLKWLGVEWDGKLYRQSERALQAQIYKKYLEKLIESGKAYWSDEEKGKTTRVIRFKNPGSKVGFNDIIRGMVEFDTTELGDFVIAKDFVTPFYHFAVVVDDEEMEISHVIRGEDHISNTPRQILLQEALGFKRPIYAHLPLILGPDRSKLSKRHGATSVTEYREAGYLPEAMVNFMALLGWNPGTDQEIFSKEELIKQFSLERIGKAGAIFDIQKLDWMNGEYIRRKSPRELLKLARPFFEKVGLLTPTPTPPLGGGGRRRGYSSFLEKIIALEQPRLKKLSELPERIDYFFKEPKYDASLLKWKQMNNNQIKVSLELAKEILQAVKDNEFTKENLEKKFMEKAGKDRGALLWPLRVALTGKKASPGPFEIMEILSKEESISRVQKAIDKLS